MEAAGVRYKSAVDSWYYLLLVAIAIVLAVAVGPAVTAGQIGLLHGLFVLLISLGLPLWLLFSTHYDVSETQLVVRSGPFRWQVPLDQIHSAESSRSLISSPALSLNRIAIKYGLGRQILVSPADRQGFLHAIGQGGLAGSTDPGSAS